MARYDRQGIRRNPHHVHSIICKSLFGLLTVIVTVNYDDAGFANF